ncbi:MAG: type III-A CRISPR-associated protein Csm2 [Candidatus Methanomethylicaceae archaeon]
MPEQRSPKQRPIDNVIQFIQNLPSMSHLKPEDYAEVNGLAEQVGKQEIKATQLRKIFHYIKDLKRQFQRSGGSFDRAKVALIMPSLAYAKGRKLIPEEFYELLALCFGPQKCKSFADFESAANFLEAIMAYHKYYHPNA